MANDAYTDYQNRLATAKQKQAANAAKAAQDAKAIPEMADTGLRGSLERGLAGVSTGLAAPFVGLGSYRG